MHRSGHRPGRGRFACAAGCCLQHRGEYGAPRLAGVPRGRVRCGGCPAALGAPSLAALLRAVLGPGHGGHGAPGTPRGLSAATPRFWPRLQGLPARSDVSGAAVPPIGQGDGAPPGASPAERSTQVLRRAEPRPVPRHRIERVPAAPLPAPRPACSILLSCRGLRWENACPLGKRNVCKMFAIN